MTSNMIYIVAFGGGLKCPHKIHLKTQCLLLGFVRNRRKDFSFKMPWINTCHPSDFQNYYGPLYKSHIER